LQHLGTVTIELLVVEVRVGVDEHGCEVTTTGPSRHAKPKAG
jgi:hypothetical protein